VTDEIGLEWPERKRARQQKDHKKKKEIEYKK
jgi:hypothetical protein